MTDAYTLFLVHGIADFIGQSDWMALKKNQPRGTLPCLIHVLFYTVCFAPFVSINAMLFIGGTHFLIDRFSLPKYVTYAKNHINPQFKYAPWEKCNITGYHDQGEGGRPFWLTLILYIVTDQFMHLTLNEIARIYL